MIGMQKRQDKSFYDNSSFVTELVPQDFDPKATWKLKNRECSVVLFYCPWCPHCQHMQKEWEEFAKMNGFMNVYAFNCEKHKDQLIKIRNDMPQLVSSFPTIVYYKNGEPVEEYRGDRTVSNFLKKSMEVCKSTSS